MKTRLLALLPILVLAACSAEPVRLYRLREADPNTAERASYMRLEQAVSLANQFLTESQYSRGFPAEAATFSLGMSDVLLHLKNEGILVVRVETAGWADFRTQFGDGVHPTENGFMTARVRGENATGDGNFDSAFFQLEASEMAAVLLRQATTMREIQARGELDYWLNYDLLGLDPDSGWMESNTIDRRAYAVQDGFYQWMSESAAGTGVEIPGEEGEEEVIKLRQDIPRGGGNYPEPGVDNGGK
ncbi:MAG: hypothetical protein GY747_13180 [Planctomycetes bacterium]|nr:hypothetical protein [Planctomycetota bacterium]MCP4772039.1 hypothetical protein [Planctomycetota bacterium]MCP4860299.1 hypothetical protein [Planctomycetota bacterium]